MIDVREPHTPAPRPGRTAAMVLAVAVHVLLALFLIYGIRWQNTQPAAVEVDLVRSVPMPATRSPEPVKEPKPDPKPVETPKPQAKPEPKPEPRPEAKPVKSPPKPDIAVKDKTVKKPEKKPEPKPEPKPSFDPIKDALKKELEQTRRQQMNNAASQELAQMQAASAASKRKAGYADRIRNKVRGNLMVPPGVSGNPEAEFLVSQLPTGEVIEVKLKRSSGIKALDDAIERAIYKSSPLPKPEQPGDFERQLDLKFRPLDQPGA